MQHIAAIGMLFVVGGWLLAVDANVEAKDQKESSESMPTCPHGAAVCGSISPQAAANFCPYMASKRAAEAVGSSFGGRVAAAIAVGAAVGLWFWRRE